MCSLWLIKSFVFLFEKVMFLKTNYIISLLPFTGGCSIFKVRFRILTFVLYAFFIKSKLKMEEFFTALIRDKEYLFCFLIHSQLRDLKVQNLFCLAKTCFWIFFYYYSYKNTFTADILIK